MGKEKETALPKNIRQIGEIRGAEKICIEDYVMTCIHKKEPQEKDGYLGIFYGEQRKEEDGIYLFLRGILEIPDGEEEAVKKELEEQKEKYFPDWDVQGCCVIGQYPTERMKLAAQLLEQTDQYVTSIAVRVGYSNFPYFSTQFKKYSGLTPVEYRNRMRQGKAAE